MGSIKRKRCLHCKCLFILDARNAYHQRFCQKPDCRKASKRASQRRWLNKTENQDYFRGVQNVQRVRQWRQAHPGYWRRKRSAGPDALQDRLTTKPVENNDKNPELQSHALQDLLTAQPAVLIGLIAHFTGDALQDHIALTLRHLQQLGQDIVSATTPIKGGHHGYQKADLPVPSAKGSPTVQLGGPSPGA
jgi:hypothetical protein